MPTYLKALALRNYRGIGPTIQKMGPFKGLNFFIGSNNSGKSSVLNFISKFIPIELANSRGISSSQHIHDLERHRQNTPYMAIGCHKADIEKNILSALPRDNQFSENQQSIKTILSAISNENSIWLGSSLPYPDKLQYLEPPSIDILEPLLSRIRWNQLWMPLTGRQGGDARQHWIPEILEKIRQSAPTAFPATQLIPAIREIGPKASSFSDYSGKGLIDRLAEIQSPDHDKRHEHEIFKKINSFLQTVTGDSTARIEIPHHREHILVHMDGKILPLSSLGTGIQEIIMIASFCTISNEQIVCIEEPELHLHPLLQRKLMRYILENTSNQYFIATHSASFIDTPDSAIFHVSYDGSQSIIRESILKKDLYNICLDLGYKASDILQSNCIVWVEGPSDRIYINHWIRSENSSLIEGIHYSIMFYGGRLLSHLSADDDADDFISLIKLNRNIAIVIDSDRAGASSPINASKARVVKEVEKAGGVAWITKGREIENYLDFSLLQEAVKKTHSNSYLGPANKGLRFDHAINYKKIIKKGAKTLNSTVDVESAADKVKIAKIISQNSANFSVLDLKSKIKQLVSLIVRSNQI